MVTSRRFAVTYKFLSRINDWTHGTKRRLLEKRAKSDLASSGLSAIFFPWAIMVNSMVWLAEEHLYASIFSARVQFTALTI